MKQFERGTVPVAMGTMGYHSATITEKRAMHSDAKYKAALAHALNPPAVPSSADSRYSVIAGATDGFSVCTAALVVK